MGAITSIPRLRNYLGSFLIIIVIYIILLLKFIIILLKFINKIKLKDKLFYSISKKYFNIFNDIIIKLYLIKWLKYFIQEKIKNKIN